MSEIPEGLLYTAEHEWIRIEGERCTIGITDYAQGELGDIVFAELPEPGDQIEQGEAFGTIEAVKTVEDLFAPVSGEVLEVHEELGEDAAPINSDPYGEGWMIVVRITNGDELESLLSPQAYGELIEER
jgi:glycine cleavage system H protein